jgi:FtsP/CotA-like multicopper oxidase with cupredoxin domain
MQFTVWPTGDASAEAQGVTLPPTLPAIINPTLNAAFPTLSQPDATKVRWITLNEVMGPAGPIAVIINGQKYRSITTEEPTVGDTEDWVIINLTADTHPIHLHLVTFQLVNRQPFDAAKYNTAWLLANNAGGMIPFADSNYKPVSVDPAPYYKGKAILPTPSEMTWKDTIQMNPGEVTTIRVRIAPQDAPSTTSAGTNLFPFDPTDGYYVWHCHIIDHEDNEMMRPYKVQP